MASEPAELSVAGGSARAEYERRLARHREEVRRRRPAILSVALALAIIGVINLSSTPMIGWALMVAASIVLMSLVTVPNHVTAWATGAEGEGITARQLQPLEADGFRVLHDRQIPGSRSNIDHIVMGPPGIVVVETKSFKGRLKIRGSEVYVQGRRRTAMLEEVRREALAVQIALADEIEAHGWHVTPVICVHRAGLPWFRSEVDGIGIRSGKDLVKRLRKAPVLLSPTDVERLAALADTRLRSAVKAPARGAGDS